MQASCDTRLQATATTVTCTWGANTTTGNLQVGAVTYGTSTNQISSISDGTNTFSQIDTCSDGSNGQSLTTFYKENATGGTTPTITVTFALGVSFRGLAVHEVSGVPTSATLDTHTCQLQSTPPTGTDNLTSGTTATPQSGDYEFAVTMDSGSNADTHNAGTGYTRDTNGSSANVDIATEHVAGGTTNAGTFSDPAGTPTSHLTAFATFKASGGGASPHIFWQD